MKNQVIIFLLILMSVPALAQFHTTVNVGEGEGGTGSADSMGISIPFGELVIGTGTKAPGSSNSLYWSAGLHVEGPLNLMALPNLSESADDSVLLINTSGSIFKSVLGKNFFTSNGTATGHRTHDFDNFNLHISDIANFTITANTNWQFGTTANDINISAITGLGMSIATTGGSNFISVSSGNFIDLSAPDIILDAPDIILEDPLTLSTWDSVLVRHPTTGEIQARLASTIGGSGADSMGLVMPTGYLLMGRGDALPDTSAELTFSSTQVVTPAGLRVGLNRASDGASNLDLVSVAGQPFSTRLFRASGANGGFSFQNAGTGNLNFSTNGASVGFGVRGTNQSVFFPAYTSTSAITGTPIGVFVYDASGNLLTDPQLTFNGTSLGLGTSTFGTSAVGVLGIANGTEPTTSPANMVQLWAFDVASSSELRVRDEAGNVTTLSPHSFTQVEPSHPMAWSYRSHNDRLALEINVDMFRVVQLLEELTGEKLIHIKSIK